MVTLAVRWTRDGNINWMDWWVRRHGYQRLRTPGESDHIGFANYDLVHNGLPKLRVEPDFLSITAHEIQIPNVKAVLEYHGFETRVVT